MTDAYIFRKLDEQTSERLLEFRPKPIMLQYMLKGVLKNRNLWETYKSKWLNRLCRMKQN